MVGHQYDLNARWRLDPETRETIAQKFVATLDQLGPFSPNKNLWFLLNKAGHEHFDDWTISPFVDVRADMVNLVEGNVQIDDASGEKDPESGYTMTAADQPADEGEETRQLFVSTHLGSKFSNHIEYQIGDWRKEPDPSLIKYDTFRSALQIFGPLWSCPWMNVSAFDLSRLGKTDERDQPRDPSVLGGAFHIPWFSYLSAQLSAGLTPPPDLICERTPGGGLILSVTRDRLDPTNPDHRRGAIQLANILIERASDEGPYHTPKPARIGPF